MWFTWKSIRYNLLSKTNLELEGCPKQQCHNSEDNEWLEWAAKAMEEDESCNT